MRAASSASATGGDHLIVPEFERIIAPKQARLVHAHDRDYDTVPLGYPADEREQRSHEPHMMAYLISCWSRPYLSLNGWLTGRTSSCIATRSAVVTEG